MLIDLIITLVFVGSLLYIVRLIFPGIDARIWNAIIALVLLGAFLYLLRYFGLWSGAGVLR